MASTSLLSRRQVLPTVFSPVIRKIFITTRLLPRLRRRARAEGGTSRRQCRTPGYCYMVHAQFPSTACRGLGCHGAIVQSHEASTGFRGRWLHFAGWSAFVNGTKSYRHCPAALSKASPTFQCYMPRCSQSFYKVCGLVVAYFAASLEADPSFPAAEEK